MKYTQQHYQRSSERGFSLVEMIVALGLFAIVSVVALGAFIKIIDSNKKAQSLKTAINNLNFTLESISREMRVGSQYYCGNSDPSTTLVPLPDITAACSGGSILAFRSSRAGVGCNLIIAYKLTGTAIQKAEQAACGASLTYDDVTSKDITVTSANFSVIIPTGGQPYAQVYLKGNSGAKIRTQSEFTLQTTISPRLMNN